MFPSSRAKISLRHRLGSKGYACLRIGIALPLLFQILLLIESARAEGLPDPERLVETALDRKLYEDRYWKILLHYRENFLGTESLIDDPGFFLSPRGKTDPREELAATVRALFRDEAAGNPDPRCRFVARYEWLKEVLKIGTPPKTSCPEFEEVLRKVAPRSAVLVFPSAYLNSPASMFGHTLIRIDGPHQSKLLAYAAGYAALPEDSRGFSYAYKGIFGYYKGYYTLLPYYERVREYGDLEHRDLWEYRLNLTGEEVRRMLLHLWELKEIYSYYYFFDENCSYNLLFLLEAARPIQELTGLFSTAVIPVDTLKAVREAGFVEGVDYRPSRGTRIRHLTSLLKDGNDRKLALRLTEGSDPGEILNGRMGEEEIPILDLAAELVQVQYQKEKISREIYQSRFLGILSARSRMRREETVSEIIPPPSPESGHDPARIALGIGIEEGDPYQEIRLRPANHALSDPGRGYQEGSQIVFLGTTVRIREEGEVDLEELALIDIFSAAPRDLFFHPHSWKVKTGLARRTLDDGNRHLVYTLNPGMGVAWRGRSSGTGYLLLAGDLGLTGAYGAGYALGIGPEAGWLQQVAERWKINLSAGGLDYAIGDRHQSWWAAVEQGIEMSRDSGLNLSFKIEEAYGVQREAATLFWSLYF